MFFVSYNNYTFIYLVYLFLLFIFIFVYFYGKVETPGLM